MKLIKKYWLMLAALALLLPTLWPIFRNDFFRMHDWLHVARLVEIDVAIKAGQVPPRWAPDFGWGYGMPLFNFYPPLPYYLAELLYKISVPAVAAIKAVFALNYLAGFYFMYLWAKKVWGKWGGMLAAVSFSYLPYRSVQFYVRGSLAELTAMTFLPLFYYAAASVATATKQQRPKYILLTGLALSGIFLSHNIIALFAVFFLPLYLLFFLKSWKHFLVSGLLAFGLSAFFILPAFLEKNLTVVDQLAGGYSHYSLHFIYLRQLVSRFWDYGGSILGPEDDISFQLGWPQLALILPSLLFLKKKKVVIYAWLALGVSVFMMTFHSQFIWQKLPFLHIAQFPWRLLAFAATLVAFLTGGIASLRECKICHSRSVLIGLMLLTALLNWQFFRPQGFMDENELYFTDRQVIREKLGDVLPDYLPKTAVKPEKIRDANDPFTQFYFPGWQMKANDDQWVEANWDKNTGLIDARGAEIGLQKTKVQTIADTITLATLAGLMVYLIKAYANKRFRP